MMGALKTIRNLASVCLGTISAALVLFFLATPVQAAYPDGPVEITVLFGNGSSADLTARVLADGMAKRLGTAVPVVNRTGGGGAKGYTYVKGQKSDGYNIVWNSNSISTAFHNGNMAFDYKAFEPVAQVSLEVPALAVRMRSRSR